MEGDVRDSPAAPVAETHAVPPPTRDAIHAHFAPYQRISPPWTPYERTKTILMAVLVLPFRVFYLALAGLVLCIVATIAMIGWPRQSKAESVGDPDYDDDPLLMVFPEWRKALLRLMFPIARSILFFCFGVYKIRSQSRPFSEDCPQGLTTPGKAYVIVANHLGYIDILVLLCKFQGSFVAKGDLERTPVIGRLARALQCMFVRKGQSLTSQLIARVQSTYACHRLRATCPGCPACMSNLVIFPEGTTTNGSAMVPFRTGVFNAGLPVKPVCIRFPHKHFNLSWETIRFREHLFRTMTQIVNHVHIFELPVYEPTEEEKSDARLYASNVQSEMAKVLEQPIIPLNRKHKFLYHSWILGKEESEAEVLMKAEDIMKSDEQLVFITSHEAADKV